jgi:hypothetical protein
MARKHHAQFAVSGDGPTTEQNRAAARAALAAYPYASRADIEASITDLIADLLHLAEAENLDAEVILDRAYGHFKCEWNEEN